MQEWRRGQFSTTTHFSMKILPAVSQLDTFGCELTLLDADTHHALCDPIQDVLCGNTHFHLVVQDCFQRYAGSKFKGKNMMISPKLSGSLPLPPGYSPPKPSSQLSDSGTSRWTLVFTRLTDKLGDIAIRCKLSSFLTQLLL